MRFFLVGLGGVIGAIARYVLAVAVQSGVGGTFPVGTWAVNLIGCFCIGALLYLTEVRALLPEDARLFFGVGILGAFTTFSAYSYETFALLRMGSPLAALLNAAGSVVCGLVAVWLGDAAARALCGYWKAVGTSRAGAGAGFAE